MAKDLLVGSGNPDKARELQLLLKDTPWTVKSLSDFPSIEEPEENEPDFEGNALLKARYYAAAHTISCVADDSGLVVDALDGEPGVYSARYAGPACSYSDNNTKLLAALSDMEPEKRTARFVCCAAFIDNSGTTFMARGTVEGRIASECRGENGFGYDSLFIPDGYAITFGEMEPEIKHQISHRAQAFATMRDWLAEQV